MKLVKNFAFTMVLVSAIAMNTFAGDQHTPGFAPPPPDPDHLSAPIETPYGTQTGENRESAAETTDYLFMEALSALLSVF